MIVKLEPASSDRTVWRVCVPDAARNVPVDFTRVGEEARSFLGDGGYFEAEPEAEGWRIISTASPSMSSNLKDTEAPRRVSDDEAGIVCGSNATGAADVPIIPRGG